MGHGVALMKSPRLWLSAKICTESSPSTFQRGREKLIFFSAVLTGEWLLTMLIKASLT